MTARSKFCTRLLVYIVALAGTTSIGLSSSVLDLSQDDIREFLSAGYQAVEQQMDDIDITFQMEEKQDDAWLISKGRDPTSSVFITWDYLAKGGKRRVAKQATKKKPYLELHHETAVSDGICTLMYWETQGTPDTDTQRGRAVLEHNSGEYLKEAVRQFVGANGSHTVSAVLASPELKIYPEQEAVNGLQTVKISAPVEINRVTYQLVFWLSPEHSCMPARMELRDGDMVRKRFENTEFQELDGGGWFPKKAVSWDFIPRDGNPYLATTRTYTLESLTVSPEIDDESVFDTATQNLPTGVLVQDMTAGIEYVAGEGPVSQEAIADIMDQFGSEHQNVSERLAESNGNTTKGQMSGDSLTPTDSDRSRTVILVVVLTLILSGIGVGILRRKKRRGSKSHGA